MKKSLSIILAALLLSASFVACETVDNNEETNANTNETVTTEEVTTEEVTTEDPGPSDKELSAAASVEEIANALINKYAEFAGISEQYDAYIADPEAEQMSYETFLSYQVSVAPIDFSAEEVFLPGVTVVPEGASEAYVYQPGMMGQAFIGYIFRVEEGTDIEAFKQSLVDNSDPRWNICSMANTTVCENFGDLVYFSMMVVADEENPFGFTVEQKNAFYNTFIETIKGSAN